MPQFKYDKEVTQSFNNVLYHFRVLAQDKTLYLEIERVDNGLKWRNEFGDEYIEEITARTGNYKSFDTFCKMLYAALDNSSQSKDNLNEDCSVFIDLLTYQDLEILKARKSKSDNNNESSNDVSQRTKNKRYLILTYVVEYDKVHYPLAVKFDFDSLDNETQPSQSQCESQCESQSQSQNEHKSQSPFTNEKNDENENPNVANKNNNDSNNTDAKPKTNKNSKNNRKENESAMKSYSNSNLLQSSTNGLSSNSNIDKQRLLEENAKLKQLLELQSKQMELEIELASKSKSKSQSNLKRKSKSNSLTSSPQTMGKGTNNIKQKRSSKMRRMLNKNNNENKGHLSRQSVIESSEDNEENEDCLSNDIENANYNKLFEYIDVLEDENSLLKTEIEKKNLEIKNIQKDKNMTHSKHISKKIESLENEIDSLSTQLLDQRTKSRRMTKDWRIEKLDFEKKIETLESSVKHYKTKCKSLTKEVETLKDRLNVARSKASQQRLYSSRNHNNHDNDNTSNKALNSSMTSLHSNNSYYDLRRSRSRTNKPLFSSKYDYKSKYSYNSYSKSKSKKRNLTKNNDNNNTNDRGKHFRSLSTSRLNNLSSSSSVGARTATHGMSYSDRSHRSHTSHTSHTSRSPSIGRFDPTAWARQRKEKIDKAKHEKTTFCGLLRTPSPNYRDGGARKTSPSINNSINKRKSRSNSNSRRNSLNSSNKNNSRSKKNKKKSRINDGYHPRNLSKAKRNSFGRTISRSRSPNNTKENSQNSKRKNNNNNNQEKKKKKKELNDNNNNFGETSAMSSMDKLKQLSEKLKQHKNKRSSNVNITFDDTSDDSDFPNRNNGSAILRNAANHGYDENIANSSLKHGTKLIDDRNNDSADSDDTTQDNASKAIRNIDARLNALQSFLRAAKSQK